MGILTDYQPGSIALPEHERTDTYRTWHGKMDMGWCWECLRCGDWRTAEATGEAAATAAARHVAAWCPLADVQPTRPVQPASPVDVARAQRLNYLFDLDMERYGHVAAWNLDRFRARVAV